MKKITSLLMLFCMCIGMAWADPTDLPEITTDLNNPIYYTIYNTRSEQPGGLMYYAGDEVGLKDGCTSVTLEDKYKFFFTGSHDALYVHNAATGKKLASVSSWTDEGAIWAVGISPRGGGLAFGPEGGLGGNDCWNDKNYWTNATTSDFTTWSANDNGSIFVAERAEEWTFPEEGKFYVIECPLFENVKGVKKAIYVNGETAAWSTEDLANKNFYWKVTINEGKVALQNVGTGKYLSNASGGMSETKVEGTLNSLGGNRFNININGNIHAVGHQSGAGVEGTLTSWNGAAGSASAWTFVEKADPDAAQEVTVYYSFIYDGEEIYSQSTKTIVGDEYPTITIPLPFGVSAEKPEGKITAADVENGVAVIEIELSVSLPFEYAEDYESVANWYYMTIHSGDKNYLYYQEGIEYLDASKKDVDTDNLDAYTWAFVGNPFDGFSIVNRLAGEDMILSSAQEPETDAEFPYMVAYDDVVGNEVWDLTTSPYGTNGFYIAYEGTNKRLNRQNKDGLKVCYWLAGADQGSTFMVIERDLTGAQELQAYIDEVEAMIETGVAADDAVGYVSFYSLTEVGIALTAAKKAVESKEGCVDALQELQAAVNAVETIQPEEGEFYIISSAMPSEDSRSGKRVYVNNTAGMQFWNEDAISNVFQFVNDGNDLFYLKSVERGTYVSTAKTHAGGQVIAEATEITDAKPIAIANMGRANVVSLIPQGGAMIHAQEAYSYVVAWNNTDNEGASAWIITKVDIADYAHTLTVDESGWASLVLGYNATIPSNVKVYTVSSVGENVANLTEVTGVIPANEPVLVNAAAGNYDFYYTEAEQSELNNLLEGTIFDTNIPLNAYVLSTKNDVFGFYKAMLNQENSTAFKNNALKAYLPATSEARFLNINFDTETGINSVDVVNGKAEVYDLSGRRVKKVQKGLYIINGIKVVK